MTGDEAARFAEVVDALDEAVSDRPDILASPVGFVVGSLVGAARNDPTGSWAQLAAFADVLAYLVMFVQGKGGTAAEVVAAIIPPAA